MPFITFIYKIGNNPKTYYGKYFEDYISDDHEGLDTIVKSKLIHSLNIYRKNKNLPNIKSKNIYIGVLSLSQSNNIPTYSTKKDIKCFDFYYSSYDSVSKIYINGKLVNN